MRLDKFLADSGIGTRSEVKRFLKAKKVYVNHQLVKEAKFQVDIEKDEVQFEGEKIIFQTFYYYMLNKPSGVISATEDVEHQTVLDLLALNDLKKDLFPVGRLDKDTEGLLFLTNDGRLAHRLLAPKKHVTKRYFAEIVGELPVDSVRQFQNGMTLKTGEKLQPAELKILKNDVQGIKSEVEVSLHEGKYHQVKRMFGALNTRVSYLQRIEMGPLKLDADLKKGEYRPLTEQEVEQLKKEMP